MSAASSPLYEFLARSGRAVVFPVYKGSFERGSDEYHGDDQRKATNLWRDYIIAFSKDLGRTLDYVATRSDIDQSRIAYFGVSRGSALAPMLLASESRIKTAVLWIPVAPGPAIKPNVRPVEERSLPPAAAPVHWERQR